MHGKVAVTGMGIISSLGNGVEESVQALLQGRSGIGKNTHISTRHQDSLSVGEVKYSDADLKQLAGISDDVFCTRTALLGILAAKEAVQSACIEDMTTFRTGLVSATTVGGMCSIESHYKDYLNPELPEPDARLMLALDCGESTERIADYLGVHEYVNTISTACSSSANAIMLGARLIRHGILDRVLVGGTDALSRHTINGFTALKILDPEPCKPFDANRQGLNLGEGAAFLVLESEKAAAGKKILCELSGYGNANDAYHQTASSPEGTGAFLAIRKALEISGLRPEDIDYINAHGTGTELNDLSEGYAIQRVFGNSVPPVSSTKSYTGHTLGAAGAIEAVFSVSAILHNVAYQNLNYQTAMPELYFKPVTALRQSVVRRVLSDSFGFGGNSTALIFSKN